METHAGVKGFSGEITLVEKSVASCCTFVPAHTWEGGGEEGREGEGEGRRQ